MISGFVTGLSSKRIGNYSDYLSYIKKKVGKFYYLHLFFLILSLPLSYYFLLHEKKGIISFVLNLLLMQSWVPDSAIWRSYNGLAWYLSTLLFLNLMLPVIQKIYAWIEKEKNKYIFLYIYILLIWVIEIGLCLFVQDNVEYWLYAFPPVRVLDFLCGYFIAKIYKSSKLQAKIIKTNSSIFTSLEVALALGIVILMLIYPYVDVGLRRQALYLPFSVLLIGVFGIGKGIISRVLSSNWITKIGDNSLYYYISHQVILKWVYKLYVRTPLIVNRTIFIDLGIVLGCLVLTIVSKNMIDYFFRYCGRRKNIY